MFCLATVLAVPTKPVWPQQFDTAFGLNDELYIPPFHNVSSHMYYDWNIQSQLLDYPVRCFPLESIVSGHKPCKLLFNQKGIFYHSDTVDCCTFVAGVGAVPPAFLGGFTYADEDTAQDMFGETHTCDHWGGSGNFPSSAFGYWTDKTSGEDIKFKDGPTGVEWNFAGKLQVRSQNASMFQLPGDCSKKCSIFGLDPQTIREPMVKLAIAAAQKK
jgi:hypothetical protein